MADFTKIDWHQMFMRLPAQFKSLTWLDLTFLIVILVGLMIGNRKGFAAFFGHLFLLVITVTITYQFTGPITQSFPFESPIAKMLMSALTFAAIAILSLFLVGIVLKTIGKVLQFKLAELVDRLGGAILGCLYSVLLFSFISNFALIFPGDWLHKTYREEALVGKFLINLSPKVHNAVVRVIPPEWRGLKAEAQ